MSNAQPRPAGEPPKLLEIGSTFPGAKRDARGRFGMIVKSAPHPHSIYGLRGDVHCSGCGDEKPRGRGVLMTREPLGPGIRFYWMCGVCSRRIARCANV